MDEIPVCLQQPIFQKLFNIAEYINLTKEEQMSYDQDLKNKWDSYSALAYAKEEGIQAGIQKGIQKGIREGFQEGIQEVALKMKDADMPLDQIANFTGLSIEQLADLKHS